MADGTQAKQASILPYAGAPHPDRTYPTLFSDGAMSIAYANGVVKFHLFRQDSSFIGDGTNTITPFAQVIMPYLAFVMSTIFFRKQLEVMVASGAIPQEMVDQTEALWAQQQKPSVS